MKQRTWRSGALVVVLVLVSLGGIGLHRISHANIPGNRHPYLQNDTGDSITVCWTTDRPTATTLRVRTQRSGDIRSLGTGQVEKRHQVIIPVGNPGGAYEYQASTDHGHTEWHPFRTRPQLPRPFRFAVMGDVGEGSSGEREVAKIIQREAPDFTVAVGDLGYPLSDESTLTERFFTPFEGYAAGHVIWHVFGNHDVKADHGRPLALASVAPDNGPTGLPAARNYSFDYGDAHFAIIDSNEESATLRRITGPWLERDMARSDRRWKFVFLHHPPYSSGQHGCSRKVQRTLVRSFERAKVDVVFAGHDHDYERFRPINGVTYIVTGDGGASLYRFEKPRSETALRDNRRHGVTLASLDGNKLVLQHINDDRRVLDRIELKKAGRASRSSGQLNRLAHAR